MVLNLTPNRLHGQVGLEILEAGKHLYSEKPLAVYRDETQGLLAAASRAGRRVGGAPDTFFGGSWQTARRAIDDGLIGEPFAALATFHGRRLGGVGEGPRPPSSPTRTPAPGTVSFFQTEGLKYGVTVAFDMGPYYLHALINLLGPARRVVGMTRRVFEEQTRMGQRLKVEAPTHVVGIVEFAAGALCQLVVSSDVYRTGLPHVEVYGTESSLRCSDPNSFRGPVYLRRPDTSELIELPCQHSYNQDSRGVGAADMAVAIKRGRPHRASGQMAAHVVDILNALHESSDQGQRIDLQTTCARPAALPAGLENWTIGD